MTGTLRESAASLFCLKKNFIKNLNIKNYLIKKHLHPIPKIYEGINLTKIANSAIDNQID